MRGIESERKTTMKPEHESTPLTSLDDQLMQSCWTDEKQLMIIALLTLKNERVLSLLVLQ